MALHEVLVHLVVLDREVQVGAQPGRHERLGEHPLVDVPPLFVYPDADLGVDPLDRVGVVLLVNRGQYPPGPPATLLDGPYPRGDRLVLVEHREAHQPPVDGHAAGIGDRDQPAGGAPGVGAARIEPERDVVAHGAPVNQTRPGHVTASRFPSGTTMASRARACAWFSGWSAIVAR